MEPLVQTNYTQIPQTDTHSSAQEGKLENRTVSPWVQKCTTAVAVAAVVASVLASLVLIAVGVSLIAATPFNPALTALGIGMFVVGFMFPFAVAQVVTKEYFN